MAKTVFIAHPMTGDIEGNTAKVVTICRAIHSEEIIPVFPSFTTRRYLTLDPSDRALAEAHINEYFTRGFIDELWLYGDWITDGMMREVRLARQYNVPVFGKTPATQRVLRGLLSH